MQPLAVAGLSRGIASLWSPRYTLANPLSARSSRGGRAIAILVTGAAGFIGAAVSQALLAQGHAVLGVDNLNPYYDRGLKEARLERLRGTPGFTFAALDIADHEALVAAAPMGELTHIVHLAAQAGVRYSLENPFAYGASNLMGHLSLLELARHAPRLERMVYASSSSVYGMNHTPPYRESEPVDQPVSLYAATKASNELMAQSYAHLYRLPLIGLRFFTVYGEWGRPDMAYWLFTKAMLQGEPIRVFNQGRMRRDFTYIDDIVSGVLATVLQPSRFEAGAAPHRVYNIGNNRPVELMEMIAILEDALGVTAIKDFCEMQPGDVVETCADLTRIETDYGFAPSTPLEVGLPRFVEWYRDYSANHAG